MNLINPKNIKKLEKLVVRSLFVWLIFVSQKLLAETLPISSTVVDTISVSDSIKVSKKDSLSYSADSIFFNVKKQKIKLLGNSVIKYKGSTIKSDTLIINKKENHAYSKGNISLRDKSQNLIGDAIYYDIKSQSGIIENGASKFDKGFYYGKQIRKIDKNTYDISNGIFTTCDALHPHFWIQSKQMRVYKGDKIVARPLTFYVNHFPLFYFPYATFSIKRGRHSGILFPEPGYNNHEGKYIKNIALYHYYKDYVDWTLTYDWMEKTGWEFHFDNNYIKKYFFKGKLNSRLIKKTITPTHSAYQFYLSERHHQDFVNNSTFDLNLNYASSKDVMENDIDLDNRTSQKMTSTFSYQTKLFNRNLSTTGSYTDDFTKEIKTIILPNISYSLPSKPLSEIFRAYRKSPIFQNISLSYRVNAQQIGRIESKNPSFADIIYQTEKDSLNQYINQHNAGIKQHSDIQFNTNIKWFNLKNTINYNEVWFDRDLQNHKLVRGADYSTRSNLSFSIFGIKKFKNFYVSAIRHIIKPNVGFSYYPDFKENDKFYRFGSISLATGKRSRNFSFGIGNTWQVKLAKKGDKKKEVKINNLITTSSSLGYSLDKDGRKFSDINHRINFNPKSFSSDVLNFNYHNSFTITEDAYDFSLKSKTISTTVNFSGKSDTFDYFPVEKNKFKKSKFIEADSTVTDSTSNISKEKKSSGSWKFSLTNYYSKRKSSSNYTNSLRLNCNFNITKNWTISYSNYYDLYKHKLISNSIQINREMHCWRLSFKWYKSGDYWNYSLNFFNIKLPTDLKFKTSDNGRS